VRFICLQAALPDSRTVLDWCRTVRLRCCVRSRLRTQACLPAVRATVGRALTPQFSCHYTSYLDFWHQHISVSSPVTYSHRSPLCFYFISRLEEQSTEATLRQLQYRRVQFCSHLPVASFFYSARLIRNSLIGSRPFQLRGHPFCPPAAQFFLIPVPLQAFLKSYLSLSSARDPVLRPLWSAADCHPLTSLALLPHQSDGFVAASSYTAVSGAATIVYGLHPQPIISVCAVFPRCASVCVSPLPFLHLRRVCASFAWTLTTYRRFVAHT
jgi:hypothetical protein